MKKLPRLWLWLSNLGRMSIEEKRWLDLAETKRDLYNARISLHNAQNNARYQAERAALLESLAADHKP